jgi:hypothetical protein
LADVQKRRKNVHVYKTKLKFPLRQLAERNGNQNAASNQNNKMKIEELNKRARAGESILFGQFMKCEIEKTNDGTKEFENSKISGPKRNLEFKKFGKKGDAVGTLKPRYAFPVGTVVAVMGFSCDVRDGYLQTDAKEIVSVD